MSLQLGLGVFSSLSSYVRYKHNIAKDALLLITAHLVWVLMVTFFTFSVLGYNQRVSVDLLVKTPSSVTNSTGIGIWLSSITIIEHSLAHLQVLENVSSSYLILPSEWMALVWIVLHSLMSFGCDFIICLH